MRVTTAFNRMLGLPGAWVRDVEFGERAVIVTVVLKAKKPVCSGCGARGLKVKERRSKPWRHLDQGGVHCRIECRLRRLYCPGYGDVYEMVPWARAGSSYTRDFDDLSAWLAQQMSQTQLTISPSLRCASAACARRIATTSASRSMLTCWRADTRSTLWVQILWRDLCSLGDGTVGVA
jgi:transposase